MLKKIEELDQDAITPSDYCLMGMHMTFDGDYSQKGIEKELREYLNDKYQRMGDQIHYVNVAYEIKDFFKLTTRFNELDKNIKIAEGYIEKEGIDEVKYMQTVDGGIKVVD